MKKLARLALLATLLAGCSLAPSTASTCSQRQIDSYQEAADQLSRRFEDAVRVANNSTRGEVGIHITDMQTIRRDAEDLETPACIAEAHRWLVAYMDSTIESFLAFQAEKYEVDVLEALYYADGALARHEQALQLVRDRDTSSLPQIPTVTPDPCYPPLIRSDWDALIELHDSWLSAASMTAPDYILDVRDQLNSQQFSPCLDEAVTAASAFYETSAEYYSALDDYFLMGEGEKPTVDELQAIIEEYDRQSEAYYGALYRLADKAEVSPPDE